MIVFMLGIGVLALGIYLSHDLIIKFLKFAIGMLLIFISLPMIFGSFGYWRYMSRGKVIRLNK
jgi:surface polysaccharide O-acyltransferase-like enzyme